MPEIVALKGVTKDYPLGSTVVRAVRGVDLVLGQGEFAAIAGPSGSGKSTLLNLIGCMDTATTGEVWLEGQETSKLTDKELTTLRLNRIGFIFQSFNLIRVLDLFQNVEFPLLLQGSLSAAERKARVEQVVASVGLSDQLRQRPAELSGGQRQRVAIARALVTEPTANLDSATGTQIIDLMHTLNQEHGTTILFSTHDPKVMERADRVIHVVDGKVEAEERRGEAT